MKTRFITQPVTSFAKEIRKILAQSERIAIATAYLSADGIKDFEKHFLGKDVRILCGIHGCISDLPALRKLVLSSNDHIEGRVFLGSNVFHPKLYIFEDKVETKIIVGSANLTGMGLHKNEEACVELTGSPLYPPISDAIGYFNNLWNANSVSVERYLQHHPEYKVQQNRNTYISPEHVSILELIKEKNNSEYVFSFTNPVNHSLLTYGAQTIPKRFNSRIKKFKLCGVGEFVEFSVYLPNDSFAKGKIRCGWNNTGEYYQLTIPDRGNILGQLINYDSLVYEVDLPNKLVHIKIKAG